MIWGGMEWGGEAEVTSFAQKASMWRIIAGDIEIITKNDRAKCS